MTDSPAPPQTPRLFAFGYGYSAAALGRRLGVRVSEIGLATRRRGLRGDGPRR